jgi:hypothetical protein
MARKDRREKLKYGMAGILRLRSKWGQRGMSNMQRQPTLASLLGDSLFLRKHRG